jgi:quinol monooxygenase YgiN
MIILIARCEIDPDALAALKPRVEETMRLTWEETDCLSYSIAVESEAAGVMIIVERWRSEAALRDYLATPAMRDFHEALQPVLISLDARIYDAAGERPLPMPGPLPEPRAPLTLVHGGNGISAA